MGGYGGGGYLLDEGGRTGQKEEEAPAQEVGHGPQHHGGHNHGADHGVGHVHLQVRHAFLQLRLQPLYGAAAIAVAVGARVIGSRVGGVIEVVAVEAVVEVLR